MKWNEKFVAMYACFRPANVLKMKQSTQKRHLNVSMGCFISFNKRFFERIHSHEAREKNSLEIVKIHKTAVLAVFIYNT